MKKKNRMYFTQETQDKIIEYNMEDDPIIRSLLYSESIQYPFEKLFENIYNTYKDLYAYINEDYFMLRSECMVFLHDKMHTYDGSRGRAFGYFGTILKRHLIQRNQQEDYKQKKTVDVEYIDDNVLIDYNANSNIEYMKEFMDLYTDYISKHLYQIFNDKLETSIAEAIIDIFKFREQIDLRKRGDKKTLYVLIRERANLTNQQTLKITGVVNKFKVMYDSMYYNYDVYGSLTVSGSYY